MKFKPSDLLEPPDLKRCQAEKPNGYSFMTLGGLPGLERCKNKPVFTVTEVSSEGTVDGLCGSMSLCADCSLKFRKQKGEKASSEYSWEAI